MARGLFLQLRFVEHALCGSHSQCGSEIKPDTLTTFAFSNCSWEVTGSKCVPGKSRGEKVTKTGSADDAYWRFDDDNDHRVEWNYLHITTRPLEAAAAAARRSRS